MTSLAKGNVPVAIFNATLSSLIGVFLTPLLMAWFVAATRRLAAPRPVILKVVLLVLLPVVLGQIARRWFADWAKRNGGWLKFVDRFIILAIVYGSFSDSIVAGVWNGHDASLIVEDPGRRHRAVLHRLRPDDDPVPAVRLQPRRHDRDACSAPRRSRWRPAFPWRR